MKIGSRQSYCKNEQAYFFGAPCTVYVRVVLMCVCVCCVNCYSDVHQYVSDGVRSDDWS